jgi:hypothetical protein
MPNIFKFIQKKVGEGFLLRRQYTKTIPCGCVWMRLWECVSLYEWVFVLVCVFVGSGFVYVSKFVCVCLCESDVCVCACVYVYVRVCVSVFEHVFVSAVRRVK